MTDEGEADRDSVRTEERAATAARSGLLSAYGAAQNRAPEIKTSTSEDFRVFWPALNLFFFSVLFFFSFFFFSCCAYNVYV